MNKLTTSMKLSLCVLALATGVAAFGQPVITSFSGNGALVCSNLPAGGLGSVEWASSLAGPWTNNWAGLDIVTADSTGVMRVSVPMFYRVRGLAPTGMALIPAGSFTMGDCMNDGYADELPVHTVNASAFYMDTNLVSYTVWTNVYRWGTNHGYSFDNAGTRKSASHPVQTVSWYDVVKWCNARSEMENLTPCYYTNASIGQMTIYRSGQFDLNNSWVDWGASGYRLPTEAEWEKAARGGVAGHRFPWPDTDNIDWSRANYEADTTTYIYDVAPTNGISYNTNCLSGNTPYTSAVGFFAPNGYGLYDMAGNVWEWCWDWYSSTYYSSSPGTDPRGAGSGSNRVLRGGSWYNFANYSRCAERNLHVPSAIGYTYGFRCVRGS